jgi:hypothetical protein
MAGRGGKEMEQGAGVGEVDERETGNSLFQSIVESLAE